MSNNTVKVSRGRPKTLNREHVLDVAMQAYWLEGIGNVSVNEICKKAGISKPGLYREFTNEDGLMKAVLHAYEIKILPSLLAILETNTTFKESLNNLITFVTSRSDDPKAPSGCLLIKMYELQNRLGEATQQQIDCTQTQVLAAYEKWIKRAQDNGEFSTKMSSKFTATYIDAQIRFASSQVVRGESCDTIQLILKTALSILK